MNNTQDYNTWSSRWIFFIAATAGAVGLGNIWKFPSYMADNGGVAFVAVYLLCIVLMGVPMMLSEVAIGHIGRANPVTALRNTALRSGASKHWSLIGYLGLLAGLCIFVMLSVVSAWSISYLYEMFQGNLMDVGVAKAQTVFSEVKSNRDALFNYQTAFVVVSVFILGLGVNKGLARGLLYFMPMSLIVLLFLLYSSYTNTFFEQAVNYLFTYNPAKLTIGSFLLAFEHAFYTLSIGVGSLIVFGAYLPKRKGIGPIVFSAALIDIGISSLVGLAIVPSLLYSQIDIASGFDLLFVALPVAYGDMMNGQYLGVLLFIFVIFTALSSALVLLEPSIAWCSQRFNTGRFSAAIMVGFVVWLVSLASMEQWDFVQYWSGHDIKLFALLNILTAKMLLPAAGLFLAIYAGWILKPSLVKSEVTSFGIGWLYLWYFLIRFIVPALFISVLVIHQLDVNNVPLLFG
jgi:NSS family neurotransmitter:Na+ symporter